MKILIIILAILALLAIAAAVILSHPAFGRRQSPQLRAKIEASPNYRNGRFQNQTPTTQFTGNNKALSAFRGFLTNRAKDRIPDHPLNAVKNNLKNLPPERDLLVWFGHSSYLFQLAGKRFLVDPLLKPEFPVSLMLHPFDGTDIYRPDDIPDIDYLIITHEHWDHLDYATLRDLLPKVKHAVCPLGIADYLEYWGYPADIITEMDWYDEYHDTSPDDSGKITCLPSRHFSNRLFHQNQTLWASFMVEYNGRKVYIGGDGGYDDRFKRIHEQFGNIDLAFLENGQYNRAWAYIHTLPADLDNAIADLQPTSIFTVHHDKFALALHSWQEPDSVAHDIAMRSGIKLLDCTIGSIVCF